MKKGLSRFRRDRGAVDPVIAVILMVGITVVLAAILYVLVSGYGEGGTVTPTGDFSGTQKTASDECRLAFGPFSVDTSWTEIRLVVANGTDTAYTWTFNEGSTSLTCVGTQSGLDSIVYTDLAGDNKVGSGDYVTLHFNWDGSGSTNWMATIIFNANGDTIGDTSFSF